MCVYDHLAISNGETSIVASKIGFRFYDFPPTGTSNPYTNLFPSTDSLLSPAPLTRSVEGKACGVDEWLIQAFADLCDRAEFVTKEVGCFVRSWHEGECEGGRSLFDG